MKRPLALYVAHVATFFRIKKTNIHSERVIDVNKIVGLAYSYSKMILSPSYLLKTALVGKCIHISFSLTF